LTIEARGLRGVAILALEVGEKLAIDIALKVGTVKEGVQVERSGRRLEDH